MRRRVFNVLLVASRYDAFMMEEDGRVEEQLYSFSLRDTSFENAVNTTMGTAGNSFLRAAAPSKVSPISPPGTHIYRFLLTQSVLFSTEALNQHERMLRMRGRPKVMLKSRLYRRRAWQ